MSEPRRFTLRARLAAAAVAYAATAACLGAQDAAVPAPADPRHRVVLETARYRVHDVRVPPGETTLLQAPAADSFAVALSHSELSVEAQDGPRRVATQPGAVTFVAATPRPPARRVVARGGAPFRHLTIELLQPRAPAAAAPPSERVDAALVRVRETPRGRAYRLDLAPNQAALLPAQAADLFVVCLSDGLLRLHFEGQTDATWRCRSGDFRLLERPKGAFLESHATAPLALVVIALH